MDYLDNIILEEINKFIVLTEKKDKYKKEKKEDVRNRLVNKYFQLYKNKYKHDSDKKNLERAMKKTDIKLQKYKILRRKKKGGGFYDVDRDDYERNNKTVTSGYFKQLIDRIDQEKSDIAAIAREVFPRHETDEGKQSHLRKILNGERPMSSRVARKLSDMISAGQIALK